MIAPPAPRRLRPARPRPHPGSPGRAAHPCCQLEAALRPRGAPRRFRPRCRPLSRSAFRTQAAALAAHGVSRSTVDIYLLVVDPRVLSLTSTEPNVTVDVRRGAADDPLAGVIRFSQPQERDVDVVVGRSRWPGAACARCGRPRTRAARGADVAGSRSGYGRATRVGRSCTARKPGLGV